MRFVPRVDPGTLLAFATLLVFFLPLPPFVAEGQADSHPLQAAAEESAPQSVAELMAAFRAMPGFEARFVEEKTLALLAVPLRSEGRLFFAPPSLLLRSVLSPTPQRVLLRGNQVRLSRGPVGTGPDEVIDLAARPEIRPLIESMLWLLRGDEVALEQAFEMEFRGRPEAEKGADVGWTLTLTPRDASLGQLLARLVVRGRGLGAEEIRVEESSGDRSVMRISEPNPNRVFSAAELEAIFGVSEEVGTVDNAAALSGEGRERPGIERPSVAAP